VIDVTSYIESRAGAVRNFIAVYTHYLHNPSKFFLAEMEKRRKEG